MSQDQEIKPVTLTLSWVELFGDNRSSLIEPDLRRQRWEEWLRLAPADAVEVWTDTDGCRGCVHLDGSWCALQDLPCTVNPILTIRHGMLGMACMGGGFTGQLELIP